ncbi:hypothetical protein ACN42_g11066, partial [Penicillium freii]
WVYRERERERERERSERKVREVRDGRWGVHPTTIIMRRFLIIYLYILWERSRSAFGFEFLLQSDEAPA